VAAGRRRNIQEELADRVRFQRRAYLLVSREGQRPAYDDSVISHRKRAAQTLPELEFAIPAPGQKYPSSSWNPQLFAMRVAESSPERLGAVEDALFGAMFRELRDISDPAVLREIARKAGVPEAEVDAALASARLRQRVAADHDEAEAVGITGVPALVIPGLAPITGAVPEEMYRQALQYALR
jgi:predicted DsbA family dithiol-disulfide isomerase